MRKNSIEFFHIPVRMKNYSSDLISIDSIETPILEGVANREYYGRSATSIENKSTIEYGTEQGLAALIYGEQGVSSLPIQDITNHCFDNSVVSSLWISEFVSQLSVFSRRISFQLVKKSTEIKLVIISDNLRNLIDGISCCFK